MKLRLGVIVRVRVRVRVLSGYRYRSRVWLRISSRLRFTISSTDKEWFAKFKPLVESFYTEHLEWFYERTFDVEQAKLKVATILAGVASKRSGAALVKKRKRVIKGKQQA